MRVTAVLQGVSLGLSPVTIGLVQASFSVAALASLQLGRLADRVGARPAMVASVGTVLVASILPAVFPSPAAAAIAGLAAGAGASAYYVAHLKLIGELSTAQNRFAYMSLSSVFFSIATTIGPLLAGISIDQAGHAAAYLSVLPITALAALVALRGIPKLPAPAERGAGARTRGALALLADRRTGSVYLVSSILTVSFESFSFLAPIYASRLGFSATAIGGILSTVALAMLLVRLVAPWIGRRARPFQLLVGAALAVSACYIVFPLSSDWALLMAIAFLLGTAFGLSNPLTQTLLYDLSPPGGSGEALGLRQMLVGCGHTAVPLVFGALGTAFGIGAVFWTIAAIGVTGTGVARSRWSSAPLKEGA
jgi:MFS family permease